MFGTGSTSWDTGLLFKVDNSAKVIRGRLIIHVRHLYTGNVNVNDILTTWSHVVFTYSDQGIVFILDNVYTETVPNGTVPVPYG